MTDSVKTIRCTNCKRDILSSNFVIHHIHCQRNIYLCSKCNEPVNHNQKEEHDRANHTLVFCTSCHIEVEKSFLKSHIANDCPHRKIKCQICDIEVGAAEISEHENYCGSRTEKCSECGEFVMLKYKQLHIDSNHTFIKLSDEPGPSPSWQNGRRTLGNFFPDLLSGNFTPQSHQKRKSGRNEAVRRRTRGSSECVDKDEKANKGSSGQNEKEKYYNCQKNMDQNSFSETQDYKRYASLDDKSEVKSYSVKKGTSYETKFCNIDSNDSPSDKDVNTRTKKLLLEGRKTSVNQDCLPSKQTGEKSNAPQRQANDYSSAVNDSPQDADLAYAIQVSNELNGDFTLDNGKLIAQAIEENTAVLSEFNLFDAIEKDKVTSGKNSKNIYSGKKLSKTVSKSQLKTSYTDDSSDDELILYAEKLNNDVDDVRLPCQFCGSVYPPHSLMLHQEECNSDKKLSKTVSKAQLTMSYTDDSSDDELILYAKKMNNDLDDVRLPCQFCGSMYPPHSLMSHQKECNSYENLTRLGLTKTNRKSSSGNSENESLVQCNICFRLIPFNQYNSHQILVHSTSSKK